MCEERLISELSDVWIPNKVTKNIRRQWQYSGRFRLISQSNMKETVHVLLILSSYTWLVYDAERDQQDGSTD